MPAYRHVQSWHCARAPRDSSRRLRSSRAPHLAVRVLVIQPAIICVIREDSSGRNVPWPRPDVLGKSSKPKPGSPRGIRASCFSVQKILPPLEGPSQRCSGCSQTIRMRLHCRSSLLDVLTRRVTASDRTQACRWPVRPFGVGEQRHPSTSKEVVCITNENATRTPVPDACYASPTK